MQSPDFARSESEKEQLRVAGVSTVLLGVLAIVLGIAFKGQNVAYMVGLAFAIAASANFPALILSISWRAFPTRAAQVSMIVGTASSLLLIYYSPAIQIDILHNTTAPFPLPNPGLISILLSFAEVERRVHVGVAEGVAVYP